MSSPTKQAQIALHAETRVRLAGQDGVVVGIQNIALARIDIQPEGKARRVAINLVGTNDIDKLIAALQAAKAQIESEQRYLDEHFARQNARTAAEAAS